MRVSDLLEGETFTFFAYRFDIDLVKKHIAAGDVPYTREKVKIGPWAKEILKLDRDRPDHKPMSMLMRIDYSYLDKISNERMNEPLIVVEVDGGWLFIDGNHRLAKAYMAGTDEMEAYVFDKKATKFLNKPVKTPKGAGKIKIVDEK